MNKQELAINFKHSGNNCCQAVLLAYAEELQLPEELLKKLGAGFGLGMGCAEGTCGALCGAEIILGLLKYHDNPIISDAKKLHNAFIEKTGACLCKDLKGITTGKMLCSCDDCVRYAVEILELYQKGELLI